MAMNRAQFENLASTKTIGSASGTMMDKFGPMYEPFLGTGISDLHYAYFDFSNDKKLTGEAKGYGAAGKIGVTFQASQTLSLGATYHSATKLSDLKTDNAVMKMAVVMGGNEVPMTLTGKMTVKDFQWPSTMGFGGAWQATDSVMIAADVKRINWSGVMKNFTMVFEADNSAANQQTPLAGTALEATLYQNWEDQTVMALGAAWAVKQGVALRIGYNHASNPIPEKYLNALFPAIVEDHVTFGAGFSERSSSIDLSVTKALEAESTNPGGGSLPAVTSKHSQLSWQLAYSYRF